MNGKGKATVKVSNGKLVKVDLNDGFKLRGDFFLQPAEALNVIEQRLEELEEMTPENIVEELEEIDAEYIGFEQEDIVEAVQKAKGSWRIINEGTYSEKMHHALDEVLTEKIMDGDSRPTLRFWYRKNEAVPIGRFQEYRDEVEHEYAEDKGIEVVRRITGGGAMYVEPGNVITYSLYLPEDAVLEDIEESYQELDAWAVEALQELGLDVVHEPLNDIKHPEGKIGGAAQFRKNSAVLHHTTISYNLDTEEMLRVLRIGKEKVSDKAIKSAEERVAAITEFIEHSREQVIQRMIEKFREKYGGHLTELDEKTLEEAEKKAEEKFSTEEWNRELG